MSKNTGPTKKGASVAKSENVDTDIENQETQLESPDGRMDPLTKRDQAMKKALEARQDELDNPTEPVTHAHVKPDLPDEPEGEEEAGPNKKEEGEEKETKTPDGKEKENKKVAHDEKTVQDVEDPKPKGVDEPPVFDKDGVPHMRLKVNGEVVELPVEKVKGIAQKNILADNRLRQATETQRKAEELRVNLEAQQAKLQNSLTQLPKKGVEVDEEQLKAFSKDFVNALFRGTVEEAEEKFTAFQMRQVESGRAPIDIDDLMERVTETVDKRARDVIEQEKLKQKQSEENADITYGYEQLKSKYPALLQDDFLFDVVDLRTEALRAEHPEWKPSQVMMAAAEEVMSRFPAATAPTPPSTDKPRSDRKANLKPVPAVRSGYQRAPAPEAKGPKTQAQVVEDMKQRRMALSGRL